MTSPTPDPLDLDTIKQRLAQATPFCACRILVKTVVSGNSTTASPQTGNTVSGGYQLVPCEFHASIPTDLAYLLRRLQAAEAVARQELQAFLSGLPGAENIGEWCLGWLGRHTAQQVAQAKQQTIETCANEVCTECRRGHPVVWHEASGTWSHPYSDGYEMCEASGIWTATGRRAHQEC